MLRRKRRFRKTIVSRPLGSERPHSENTLRRVGIVSRHTREGRWDDNAGGWSVVRTRDEVGETSSEFPGPAVGRGQERDAGASGSSTQSNFGGASIVVGSRWEYRPW